MRKYELVYLATPYSKYPGGIQHAFAEAARLSGRLLQAGIRFYSPIVHTHPIALFGDIDPLNHAIWLPFDQTIMNKSDALLVAKMPTWQISFGISEEIKWFTKADKPIHYLDVETMEVGDAAAVG